MRADRAREPATRAGGARGVPLALIHRNKSPNPALARLPARFDFPEGAAPGLLGSLLKLPFPLALELLRRAAYAAKSDV